MRYADKAIGLPNNPAVIPGDIDTASYTSNVEMSLTERLHNVWNYLLVDYHYTFLHERMNQLKRKHFSEELLKNNLISLIFYNHHHSMLSRNYVPNAIEVGGIHLTPAQPLPKVSLPLLSKMNCPKMVLISFKYNVVIQTIIFAYFG